MTTKFIGEITIEGDKDSFKAAMPSGTSIPEKKDWHNHPIWQYNGKAYKPLTPLAEKSLEDAIKKIQSFGKTKATKEGKIKPTSIKYAILSTGSEPFFYI